MRTLVGELRSAGEGRPARTVLSYRGVAEKQAKTNSHQDLDAWKLADALRREIFALMSRGPASKEAGERRRVRRVATLPRDTSGFSRRSSRTSRAIPPR